MDTKHIEFEREGPPLVDAERHGFYQAIYCKDNTSKDPFSQCESPPGIRVQEKLKKWVQRQQLN